MNAKLESSAATTAALPICTPAERWRNRLTGPVAAAVVLALFWAFMMSSVREKSLTSDEIVHAAAGYTYWKYRDYRLNPENGILPQRVMAIPLVLGNYRPPPRDNEAWRNSDEWTIGDIWFHQLGNDLPGMLRRGRGAIGLLTVALGALVWWWARRLFGPIGGMLSLLVFVTSPIVLANGALMTSDATCSLFFLAAVTAVWATLHRLTLARVILGGLVIGGLFVSKMSAVLILPIGLILLVVRVASGRPLWIGAGLNRELTTRRAQLAAFAIAGVGQAMLVLLVIWGCYGFRYRTFAPPIAAQDRFPHPWDYVLEKPEPLSLLASLKLTDAQTARANEILARADMQADSTAALNALRETTLTPEQGQQLDRLLAAPPQATAAQVFEFIRAHEWLPEGYIYGYAHAWRFARRRSAFFNGEYGISGWKTFFPYAFAVKTPLPLFGIMAFALAAGIGRRRSEIRRRGMSFWRATGPALYATLPLWTLFFVYWAAVIPSRLNIGHRHIMATYAPLFVLCGAAAYWLEVGWLKRRRLSGAQSPARIETAASSEAERFDKHQPGYPVLQPNKPRRKLAGAAVAALLVALLAETLYRYPHYLAYFNGLVTPRHAYRHLVDSSLDWGQDLPGLKRYLDAHPSSGPVYLSYFGTASPRYYGISAHYLFCAAGLDRPRTPVRELHTTTAKFDVDLAEAKRAWPDCQPMRKTISDDGNVTVYFLQQPPLARLAAGTYCISATMLPAIWFGVDGPLGPWNERFEAKYRELERTIRPLLVSNLHEQAEAFGALSGEQWTEVFSAFAEYRFARLTAYLRQREPDDEIGYSILVFKLTDADIAQALDGPPAEHGIDLPTVLIQRGEL